MRKKIGLIGVGNMGEALLKGLLSSKTARAEDIFASDTDKDKLKTVADKFKLNSLENNCQIAAQVDILILAVKPHDIKRVLKEVSASLREKGKLLISLAAGITTSYLEGLLSEEVAVIRAMPNTPALVGAGITAISAGKFAGEKEISLAEAIFQGVGKTVRVEEKLINAVTALSGSGPAYLFAIMEALIKAGEAEGLSKKLAETLISETVLGAVKLYRETGAELTTLREKVTSPGGTTEAALKAFREKGLAEVLTSGVRAAAQRARELTEENK